jgi:hypothetical protein
MLPVTFVEDMRSAIIADWLAPQGVVPAPVDISLDPHLDSEGVTHYDPDTNRPLWIKVRATLSPVCIAGNIAHELVHAAMMLDESDPTGDFFRDFFMSGHGPKFHNRAALAGQVFPKPDAPGYTQPGPKFREWFNKKSTELYGHVI